MNLIRKEIINMKFKKLLVLAVIPAMLVTTNSCADFDYSEYQPQTILKANSVDYFSETTTYSGTSTQGATVNVEYKNNWKLSVLQSMTVIDFLNGISVKSNDSQYWDDFSRDGIKFHPYQDEDGYNFADMSVTSNSKAYDIFKSVGEFKYYDLLSLHTSNNDDITPDFNFNIVADLNDGGSKTIQVSSDSHYTEAELVAMVSAQDLFGKPCEVTVSSSDYVDAIGTYTIVLTASDDYGQTATATLIIVVLDKTAPVMIKKNDLTIEYYQTLTTAEVYECVSASDNSGEAPTLSIHDDDGFEFGRPALVGQYNVIVRATDSSGNYADLEVMIDVVDRTAPVISKKSGTTSDVIKYGFSKTYSLNNNSILALYSAVDEIDGDCDLYVKSGSVSNDIGTHQLTIASMDLSDNESSIVVNYQIVADIPPVFILDSRLVQVSEDNPLTKEQVLQLACAMAPENSQYVTLINDAEYESYENGSDKVGTSYKISYSYSDENENIQSDYLNLLVGESITDDNIPVWQKIKNFFTNIGTWLKELGQRIKNLFSLKGWKTDEELESASN